MRISCDSITRRKKKKKSPLNKINLDKALCEAEIRLRCPRCNMGQLSFLRLSAGTMPSFCKRSQSHGRRLKMLTGLGLCTWLLQRQRPLFLTQGWIINFFFVFTRVLPSHRKKNCLAVRVCSLTFWHLIFFFSQAKLLRRKWI